jgi:hypothetical protein
MDKNDIVLLYRSTVGLASRAEPDSASGPGISGRPPCRTAVRWFAALGAKVGWRWRWQGIRPPRCERARAAVWRARWPLEQEAQELRFHAIYRRRPDRTVNYKTTKGQPVADLWHLMLAVSHGNTVRKRPV